ATFHGYAATVEWYRRLSGDRHAAFLAHLRVLLDAEYPAEFEEPNQDPVGINFVIVNGQIEVDGGQRTPALAGRVLRGPGYAQ
ncbi:MAG: hypothetical protein ACMG6H_08040, partial [Acidobacteriota bacterium]